MINLLPYSVLFCTILWVDWAVLLHGVLAGALSHLEVPKWLQSHGWKSVPALAGNSAGSISQGLWFSSTRVLLRGCLDFLTAWWMDSNIQRWRVPYAWKWKLQISDVVQYYFCLIVFVIGPAQMQGKEKWSPLYHERSHKAFLDIFVQPQSIL